MREERSAPVSFTAWLGVMALAAVVLFRLPFIPYTVIDWDESTFTLVGDSLARGHLPYTEIVENKPPLIFFWFAFLQLLVGKSIVALRAGGILLLALSAWMCALVAHRGFGLRGWSLLAILPIAAMGTFAPGSGAMMAEHLALPFVAMVLLLMTAPTFTPTRGFLLGLCAALAVMTRTNLAYPALLLAAGSFILPLAPGCRRLPFLFCFGLGAVLPLFALLWAYRHHLALLQAATVTGPLIYAGGGRPFTAAWFREAAHLLRLTREAPLLPLALGALAGAAVAVLRVSPVAVSRRMTGVLALGWMGTMVGICAGGRIFGHYLMQLLPFSAPLLAVAVEYAGRRRRVVSWVIAIVLAGVWGEPLARKYLHHARRLMAGEPLWNDPATRLVRYLEERDARGQPLFLLDGHIAYWLLDSPVPTRVGHPSNFGRTAMTRAVEGSAWHACREFDAIFARQPLYVVVQKKRGILGLDKEANRCLDEHLGGDYRLEMIIENLQIFRRIAALDTQD